MSAAPSRVLSVDCIHPSLPGHFPGSPVVPGVVFLSYILIELYRQMPGLEVCGVHKLKFLSILLPQQAFVVEFAPPKRASLRFKCWRLRHDAQQASQTTQQTVHQTANDDNKRELLVDGHLLLREHERFSK